MFNPTIRPSTIDGIKRLAKQLKAQHNSQHHVALDEASRSAGFQNFRHAQKSLKNVVPTHAPNKERSSSYPTFITASWRDKATGQSGRETLCIELSAPRLDLMSPSDVSIHHAFSDFRNSGPDHLERHYLSSSQERARKLVCAAARAMQFMDATKLRPSKAFRRAYPGASNENKIPGNDHSSVWFDQTTRRYLFVDEPYEGRAEGYALERAAWAKKHNQVIVKSNWLGMYYPGYAHMYLISDKDKGVPLDPIIAALDRLSDPITPDVWTGESAPMLPPFISPGSIAKEKERQARPKSSPRSGSRNTVGYVMPFVGARQRPDARMPIKTHEEIGALLNSVLAVSFHRKGVYNVLDSVRSELDEWVQREYPSEMELPSQRFFKMYYSEQSRSYDRKIDESAKVRHLHNMDSVMSILTKHYPECAPLRAILRKLERAKSSLQNWSN